MELCKELPSKPEQISKTKMFGHYVHALTAHTPIQLELACLHYLNKMKEELKKVSSLIKDAHDVLADIDKAENTYY